VKHSPNRSTSVSSAPEPSEEALLAEYEACEDYVSSAASRDWQAAGIIWAAALAGLFLTAFAGNGRASVTITTFIAFIVIATLWLFWAMVKRMVFLQKACMQRMREIEVKLGLRRSIYLYVLDNWRTRESTEYWEHLTQDEKSNLEKNYLQQGQGAPRLHTSTATYLITALIAACWIVIVLLKWLAYKGWFS